MIIDNYTLLNPEHRFVVAGIAFGRKDILRVFESPNGSESD